MKEAPSTCQLCPALKSFFSDKISKSMLCGWNSPNKYRRLDPKLERKMAEAIKQRAASGRNTFRSMNSIIMRFPQFKEGLRKFRTVFEQYDEDSNGTIDHEELKRCLNKLQIHLTEKEIADLYHSCDMDGNEGIQFNEFIVLLCLIYLLMEAPAVPQVASRMNSPQIEIFDTLVEAFLFLDKNGDGKLNKKDMVRALNEGYAREKSPRHISMSRFKEMDWSKSGEVSFKEFLFALTNWIGVESVDADDNKEISIKIE